jgi:hypothetical protein
MTRNLHTGVWVSDIPFGYEMDGQRLLAIDIPETVVAGFEWTEDGKTYREWLVPAEVLNRYGVTEVMNEEEP